MDRKVLCVIGMFSGLVTPAQASWHPRRGEAYAQRMVRRACRGVVGLIPARCYTDHAHFALDANALEADHTIIRWVADITLDGSSIHNLSGRACHLGDGLSRHDLEHREQMRYQAFAIRELTLDQLLDEGDDGQGPVPFAIPSQAVGTPLRLGRPFRTCGSRSARRFNLP